MYYINYFFVFSILGHFLESFFYPGSSESGILYGPYTPIYGIGVCLIIYIYHILKKRKIKFSLTTLYIFLFGFIGLSLIELLGGFLIEKLFHVIFWDYSNLQFNIGHYIALEMAFIWGISSLLVVFFLRPICDKFITKIPKIISWILVIILTFDILITLFTKVLF